MSNNRPAYEAIIRAPGETPDTPTWLKVGAAWETKDKRGLNLVLGELPFVPDGSQTIYLRATPSRAVPATDTAEEPTPL